MKPSPPHTTTSLDEHITNSISNTHIGNHSNSPSLPVDPLNSSDKCNIPDNHSNSLSKENVVDDHLKSLIPDNQPNSLSKDNVTDDPPKPLSKSKTTAVKISKLSDEPKQKSPEHSLSFSVIQPKRTETFPTLIDHSRTTLHSEECKTTLVLNDETPLLTDDEPRRPHERHSCIDAFGNSSEENESKEDANLKRKKEIAELKMFAAKRKY
ncbi:hypothetical protein QTN25_008246 [Entamoeba marina]